MQRQHLLVVVREAKVKHLKHHSLELCFSKRAKLVEVLREVYAEVQLENVSLQSIMFIYEFSAHFQRHNGYFKQHLYKTCLMPLSTE